MNSGSWFLELYLQVDTFDHLFNQLRSVWILIISLKAFRIPSGFILSINLINISILNHSICKSITPDRILCYDSDLSLVCIIKMCTPVGALIAYASYMFLLWHKTNIPIFFIAEKCVAKISAFPHLPVWRALNEKEIMSGY